MIELPKVYVYAIWIAMLIHILFMVKHEEYLVSYWYQNGETNGPGRVVVIVKSGKPTAESLETAIREDNPNQKIAVTHWQRTDYGWTWKPFWK